jgi:filamentous hemagglutinin
LVAQRKRREPMPQKNMSQNSPRKLILNTRTSVTLDRAGIPKSAWYGTNKTGVSVPDMPSKTFDDLAADQLKNNKLPSTGNPTMPKGKK